MSRNRFPGPCFRCDEIVLPGEGYTLGKPGEWKLTHERCIPVAVPASEPSDPAKLPY